MPSAHLWRPVLHWMILLLSLTEGTEAQSIFSDPLSPAQVNPRDRHPGSVKPAGSVILQCGLEKLQNG